MKKKEMLCVNCEHVGKPNKVFKGTAAVELLLYMFFILPGLLYSSWRVRNAEMVCPKCKAPGMIPLDSPKAQKILA